MPIRCREVIASDFVTWKMKLDFLHPPKKRNSNWTIDSKTSCWNWKETQATIDNGRRGLFFVF